MRNFIKMTVLSTCLLFAGLMVTAQHPGKYVLVIHGGAGAITPEKFPPEIAEKYRVELLKVLRAGDSVLAADGSAMDAVETCIRLMEDCPLFNAGKGAVYNSEGRVELDASVMDGKTGLAGAVAGVSVVRNPISAARAVMEHTEHLMLSGKGAETFAKEQGLDIVEPSYFYTEQRWNDYLKAKARNDSLTEKTEKHGTVGCVALDKSGNLAAGTSTGGMFMKKFGRVGDSPIIGAGTYANNQTCAVSCTGHGEFFIRNVVAYDIAALMKYKGLSLNDAAGEVVMHKLKQQDGNGGVIALDAGGNIAMPFNTGGMFRGYKREDSAPVVAMFAQDKTAVSPSGK